VVTTAKLWYISGCDQSRLLFTAQHTDTGMKSNSKLWGRRETNLGDDSGCRQFHRGWSKARGPNTDYKYT